MSHQSTALAGGRALRGRVHVRHGCRQHPSSLPPPQRRHPRRRDVGVAVRARSGGAAAGRPLSRVRHAADVLSAGVVHRALSAGGGAHSEGRSRGRSPPLSPRACQRDAGRRGAVLVRTQRRRHREGDGQAPRGLPGGHLPLFPATPSTSSSSTDSSTTRPCSGTTSPMCWRMTEARSSNCRATTASTTGRTTSSRATSSP